MTLALPGIDTLTSDDRAYWTRRLCFSLHFRHEWQPGTYGRRFYTNRARWAIDELRGRSES